MRLSWIWLPLTTTAHHPLRSLVFPWLTFWAFPLFSDSLCLPGLPIYSDRLLPALLTLPACWYLLCLLPAPTLHCPCCWFCLAFITPVTTFDHCLSDHLLSINKAAIGSNYTASSLQRWGFLDYMYHISTDSIYLLYNINVFVQHCCCCCCFGLWRSSLFKYSTDFSWQTIYSSKLG